MLSRRVQFGHNCTPMTQRNQKQCYFIIVYFFLLLSLAEYINLDVLDDTGNHLNVSRFLNLAYKV